MPSVLPSSHPSGSPTTPASAPAPAAPATPPPEVVACFQELSRLFAERKWPCGITPDGFAFTWPDIGRELRAIPQPDGKVRLRSLALKVDITISPEKLVLVPPIVVDTFDARCPDYVRLGVDNTDTPVLDDYRPRW